MNTQHYTVVGMTCAHCVASVSEEVSEIAGVLGVDVDLTSGVLTVRSEEPLAELDVERAVVDAGYQLA